MILSGTNTYTGGTTVSAGILQGSTTNLQGNILDNANVTFNQAAAGTYSVGYQVQDAPWSGAAGDDRCQLGSRNSQTTQNP